jgi:ABC-type transport system substrate-binding protein
MTGVGLAGVALIGCADDDDDDTSAGPPAATRVPSTAATVTTDPFAHVTRGGIFQTALAGDPPSLTPYGSPSFASKSVAGYVYSRMYKIGARPDIAPHSALPEPDLAEVAETEDGQTWTVKIRDGAVFQDIAPVNGRKVTAEDAMFSWRLLTAPESPSAGHAGTLGVENIEAVDDTTIKIDLARPSAAFLDFLADSNHWWIMPAEADGAARNSFDPTQRMIGSGPWILEQHDPSAGFEFAKNPDWHVEGKPFLDGVRLSVIPEYRDRLAQLRAGNVHVSDVNANDVLQLRSDLGDLQWRGLQPSLLSFIYFSPVEQDPGAPWRDARFRRAVSMATDRKAITDSAYNVPALQEAGLDVNETWNNLIPAGFTRWWLDPRSPGQGPSAKYFEFNRDEAGKLLDAVGGSRDEFTYQYTINRYGSTFNNIAEEIESFLLEAGMLPKTDVQDYDSVYFPRTFHSKVGGYFPRMFGDDPANHSRIIDPRITELAAKQAAELDEEARRNLIWEIQRLNASEMHYVPQQAGAGTDWAAWRPEVRGIVQTRGYGQGTEAHPNYWLDT